MEADVLSDDEAQEAALHMLLELRARHVLGDSGLNRVLALSSSLFSIITPSPSSSSTSTWGGFLHELSCWRNVWEGLTGLTSCSQPLHLSTQGCNSTLVAMMMSYLFLASLSWLACSRWHLSYVGFIRAWKNFCRTTPSLSLLAPNEFLVIFKIVGVARGHPLAIS